MKVLLGDDHQLFRAALRGLLNEAQDDITGIETGTFSEAMSPCGDGDRYDLILLDLNMLGWPGFEGIRAIRARHPDTSLVVILTAYSAEAAISVA